MLKRYVIRICTDSNRYFKDQHNMAEVGIAKAPNPNYIEPAFLTCLENAELGKLHDTDRDGYTFDLFPPEGFETGREWAEQNAARMSRFGLNAVAAPRWEK